MSMPVTKGRIFAACADDPDGTDDNVSVNAAKNHGIGTIIAVQDDYMQVQCGNGTLRVTQVQKAGRRAMGVRDFSHSLRLAGRRLG